MWLVYVLRPLMITAVRDGIALAGWASEQSGLARMKIEDELKRLLEHPPGVEPE